MSRYTAVSILSRPPAARPPEPSQAANRPKLTQGQARVTAMSPAPRGTPGQALPRGRRAKRGCSSLGKEVWGSPQCCLAWQTLGGWGGPVLGAPEPIRPHAGASSLQPTGDASLSTPAAAQPLHPPRLWSGDLHSPPPALCVPA